MLYCAPLSAFEARDGQLVAAGKLFLRGEGGGGGGDRVGPRRRAHHGPLRPRRRLLLQQHGDDVRHRWPLDRALLHAEQRDLDARRRLPQLARRAAAADRRVDQVVLAPASFPDLPCLQGIEEVRQRNFSTMPFISSNGCLT